MKKIFIFASLLFLLTGCSEEGKITEVTCDQMKDLLKSEKAVLVDVRSKEEYDEGHLDGAKNRPLTQISDLKDVDKIDLKTPIIVYCKSGVRSSEAAKMLLEIGYKNIYNLGAMSKCG